MLAWAHWVNVGAIGAATGICAVVYRQEFRKPEGTYLSYWLGASASWILYYTLRATGVFPQMDLTAEHFEIRPIHGVEFAINFFNSLCVLLASAYLRKGAAQTVKTIFGKLGTSAVVVSALIFLFSVVWIGIAGAMGGGVSSNEARGWCTALMLSSSFVGGAVLILFYHRLAIHRNMTPRQSGVVLTVFFTYAYIQAWYPYVLVPKEHTAVGIIVTFLIAAVLKAACTIAAFAHSRTPVRTDPIATAGA